MNLVDRIRPPNNIAIITTYPPDGAMWIKLEDNSVYIFKDDEWRLYFEDFKRTS